MSWLNKDFLKGQIKLNDLKSVLIFYKLGDVGRVRKYGNDQLK